MLLLLFWERKVGLKIQPNAWGNYCVLYHKTNKEASTVLCSVARHLGSGKSVFLYFLMIMSVFISHV